MRVLVTGVSGQVGSALLTELKGRLTVIAADRSVLDLTQLDKIAEVFDRIAPDIIINSAAYTAVDKAEDEATLAMLVNKDAPGAMARWAAAHCVPLIHLSTDYVFDGSGKRAWREEDPTCPLSVYGVSKAGGESQIRAAGGNFLIVRTCWVYAAQGKNFLRTIVRLAGERKELRVVHDQIGAPTTAAQIARSIAEIVTRGIPAVVDGCARSQGFVHLAASGETSWHGFATAIVEGLKNRGMSLAVEKIIPIQSGDYPSRAKRPLNSRLDLGRLTNVFGIKPAHWATELSVELDVAACSIAESAPCSSFGPIGLGGATGRGAEPASERSVPSRCIAGSLSFA